MSDGVELKAALAAFIDSEEGVRAAARRMGVDPKTLRNWLQDQHGITVRNLLLIADSTGVPVEDLLARPHYGGRYEEAMEALSALTNRRLQDLDIAKGLAAELAAKRRIGD